MDNRRGLLFVVDDDPALSALVAELLRAEGYGVSVFESGEQVLQALTEAAPSAVLLDLNMPGIGGEATLERIVTLYRHLPVLVLTAERDPERVVAVIRLGAYDFLPKPIDRAKLLTCVHNAVEKHRLVQQVAELVRTHESRGFPGMVGDSPQMRALAGQIERVAASDVTVHLHGESGTGKELVARAIHDASGRLARPFVALNCAALPEGLQESELFGHEKGAFTGAAARKPGRFEQVAGGTLFLDEVAELSLSAQAKLLRVLQERVVQRVGGTQEVPVDFRLITATHRDLDDEVARRRFREDLYYRMVVFELELPPLRDRSGDVPLLTQHFLEKHGPRLVGTLPLVSREALLALSRYRWPGNVRELENTVQRALVSCDRECIQLGDLPPRVSQTATEGPAVELVASAGSAPAPVPPAPSPSAGSSPSAAAITLEAAERLQIIRALEACKGNRSLAAQRLAIGRTTLYRKLKEYGLE
jgi:two-component system, NtrC family, response regulator HydG